MSIQIVSASAGTGKTYYLSHELPDLVTSEQVAPDRILATSFTNKAADELTARIRTELLRAGKTKEARKLALSHIGTVNAVCGRLLKDFAFDLGLSPDLQVADEILAQKLLDEAVGQAASDEELAELADLAERLSGKGNPFHGNGLDDWQAALKKILDKARGNAMSPDDLEEAKKQSLDQLHAAMDQVTVTQDLDERMREILQSFSGSLPKGHQKNVDDFLSKEKPRWAQWETFSKMPEKYADIIDIASQYPGHPRLREDLRRQTELVFDLAIRCLAFYQQRKEAMGVVDFTDQEAHLMALLKKPEIVTAITEKFDLIMVDEFQDTSPLELAIFLKLCEKIPKAIWVGDQKQAIYGFRDTDPELMNAVIEELEEDEEAASPIVLEKSWRSRAGLVDFTSDLFVPAFESSIGLLPERVRITAADPVANEPGDLGDCLEVWSIEGSSADAKAVDLVEHVRALLQDADVKTWHHQDDPESRPITPGDVAILARTNKECDTIAGALACAGLPVSRGAAGLLKTAEARLILAALNLWLDARNKLAKAEITRLLTPENDSESWLLDLLSEGESSLPGGKIVADVINESETSAGCGVRLAFNKVVEMLPLSELMQRWGNFDQRVANIAALQKYLEQYLDEAKAVGDPQTVAGFLIWIKGLTKAKNKDRGGAMAGDAVNVLTWHGAKGLEWPIVILTGWDKPFSQDAFGVTMISESDFSIEAPLADRWIRYWPNPLSGKTKTSEFHDLFESENTQAVEVGLREELRCLYVAMTRPRTRLILARQQKSIPAHLADYLVMDAENQELIIGDKHHPAKFREVPEDLSSPPAAADSLWYDVPDTVPEYPPARIQPSSISAQANASVAELISLGERISVTVSEPDYAALGDAIHGFMAADPGAGADTNQREDIAARLVDGFRVKDAISTEALVSIADRLEKWIKENHPGARLYRELPFSHPLENGTLVEGSADLVIETDGGFAIIDHKTFPGSADQCRKKAESFSGQLGAYAEALTAATGKPVLGTYIHFPVSGYLMRVSS